MINGKVLQQLKKKENCVGIFHNIKEYDAKTDVNEDTVKQNKCEKVEKKHTVPCLD